MVDEADETTVRPLPALQNLIAEIKNAPSAPANIQPESGLLAEHLAILPESSTESFNEGFNTEAWNRTWDDLERKMDAEALADESDGPDTSLL